MPHPPSYSGGQDDDQPRSIDVVHIEPSIREGTNLVSSMYGSDASAPLFRFPPTNTGAAPYITGEATLPGRIRCIPGTWSASPRAEFSFQWMLDGVDIPAPEGTGEYLDTTIAMDGQEATCEVRGFNNQGENYAVTPVGLTLSILEPIETFDFDMHVIGGLGNTEDIFLSERMTKIITGISALNTMTTLRAVAYFTTGISALNRTDINSMLLHTVSGIDRDGILDIKEASGVGVVSYMEGSPLQDGVPQAIALKNWGAELGLNGWTVFGEVEANAQGSGQVVYEGNYAWSGGRNVHPAGSNTPYSYMEQTVNLESVWLTDVDAGSCFLELEWYQYCIDDHANVQVEFLDVNDNSLGSSDPSGLWASPTTRWWLHSYPNIPIPTNTRKVKIIVEFLLITPNDINAWIDAVHVRIRRGAQIVNRSFGPNFERWRLRFTQSPNYSGAALSELEFRATSGGADLATGGTPIAGSVGNGGSIAAAFDDARNSFYWAGEINGVNNGTAWIGYDMGTPVKPQELDITARQAAQSNHMGTEFFLEGSNDSITWIPVQYYPNVPEFTASEQRQFEVMTGTFTGQFDGTSNTDLRNNAPDTDLLSSMVWYSNVRQDITHIRLNSYVAQDFRIHYGIVRRIGSEYYVDDFISLDVTTTHSAANAWEDFALVTDLELEVGDYFFIAVEDTVLTNVNGIPLWYHADDNNGAVDLTNWKTATRIIGGGTPNTILTRGTSLQNGPIYAIDFRGTIF
jgi:hypothetical protein